MTEKESEQEKLARRMNEAIDRSQKMNKIIIPISIILIIGLVGYTIYLMMQG